MGARIYYVLSKINRATINSRHGMTYHDDMDEINIDEKWFQVYKDGQTFYLAPGEAPPERRCKHKSYQDKVMFLSAVARPRLIDGVMWDGKLGIFPVGEYEPAKKNSSRRPAGTMEWKNKTMDAARYRMMMLDDVIPAILDKWPLQDRGPAL